MTSECDKTKGQRSGQKTKQKTHTRTYTKGKTTEGFTADKGTSPLQAACRCRRRAEVRSGSLDPWRRVRSPLAAALSLPRGETPVCDPPANRCCIDRSVGQARSTILFYLFSNVGCLCLFFLILRLGNRNCSNSCLEQVQSQHDHTPLYTYMYVFNYPSTYTRCTYTAGTYTQYIYEVYAILLPIEWSNLGYRICFRANARPGQLHSLFLKVGLLLMV